MAYSILLLKSACKFSSSERRRSRRAALKLDIW